MDSSERMKRYRERLRREGLRPVQIWVPDRRRKSFRKALRAQVRRLNAAEEADALDFIEKAADWPKQ